MTQDTEFSWYDIQAKRKYLLDVFTWIKDVYPIYETIYTYLHDTEFPSETILNELYMKLEEIGLHVHETEIISHFYSIVDKIEQIRVLEKQDIEPNPDDLLANI